MAEKREGKTTTVVGLSLVDIDIDFNPDLEEVDEIELSYGARITPPKEAGENIYVFRAEIVIRKGGGEAQKDTSLSAIYLCAMRCRGYEVGELMPVAQRYTRTVVWGNFASLAAVVLQQMRASFPILPPLAGPIDIIREEDDGGENPEPKVET